MASEPEPTATLPSEGATAEDERPAAEQPVDEKPAEEKLEDDGRDGATPWRAASSVAAGAAIVLLLPRQYFAAGLSAILAAAFWLLDRVRRRR